MKFPSFVTLTLAASVIASPTGIVKRTTVPGIDVSSWQPNIDWPKVKANGIKFAYIKATEAATYRNPLFSSQYSGATRNGIIRGPYHYAQPGSSSGAAQANYFVANGGGWTADGITLPGALDLEGGCSGLSQSAMVAWIRDFSNTYHSKTGRYPVFYTTTSWWTACTGNNNSFGKDNPLWIARWGSTPGKLPSGWSYATFWQYADNGSSPGDADYFTADLAHLQKFAKGG